MTPQQIADELLHGWQAARDGEPLDETRSDIWQEGWRLWTETLFRGGGVESRHAWDGQEKVRGAEKR